MKNLFHSSFLDFVPELWPWIWAVAPAVLPSSLGKRTPSKAPVPHDARAQPCVDCIVPLGSTSLASVLGASTLLARGGLLGRGRASLPLSAATVLLPALPREGELPGPGRTRYASSLPCPRLSCTASLDSAVHAPPIALVRSSPALPVRLQHRHVFWCQPPRRRQTAQERHPHARTGDRIALGRLRALLRACS